MKEMPHIQRIYPPTRQTELHRNGIPGVAVLIILSILLVGCETTETSSSPLRVTSIPGAYYYTECSSESTLCSLYAVNQTSSTLTYFTYDSEVGGAVDLNTLVTQGASLGQQVVQPFQKVFLGAVQGYVRVWVMVGAWHYNGKDIQLFSMRVQENS